MDEYVEDLCNPYAGGTGKACLRENRNKPGFPEALAFPHASTGRFQIGTCRTAAAGDTVEKLSLRFFPAGAGPFH